MSFWGSGASSKPKRASDRPIGFFGNFNNQEKKIDAPKGAIVVYNEAFCPNCQIQLATRKEDKLMYCPKCAWNFQKELLKSKERKKNYDDESVYY
jgi:ribosomal protein L37AE/L43A